MERFSKNDDLAGAEFSDTNLRGAWFRECDLREVRFRGSTLAGAEIDADIDGLKIYGIEVAPLVEAELDRRHPERSALRATTADEMRAGWAALEAMWAQTLDRVSTMPPDVVEISVGGEWSFAQTLRHLVFATDVWLGDSILGKGADAYHRIAVPYSGWRDEAADVLDLDATPPFDEVLGARGGRVAMVRDFLATVSDAQLDEQRDSPIFVGTRQFPVRQCLWIVMNEEWHHHRFAVRDLDVIAARTT